MKYSTKFSIILVFQILLLFGNTCFAQTNCENPLSLDWLQFSLGNPCVEGIYAFEYNGDPHIYVVSKQECIAADSRNTLYNCADESFCYYLGFTLADDQCDQSLIDEIAPLLTNQTLIYPLSISRTCENPLELNWVQESLDIPCTDGIYAFEFGGASYIYQSTACEFVDVPNRLYNCDDKSSCFVEGKTLPEDQCSLIELPLKDYLTDQNLIWSSPLLRLVPDYPWLTSKVNLKQCDDVEIKEFKTNTATYLSIKNNNAVELFAQNGSLLCTNANNFNCETAYGLTAPIEEWACNARIDEVCGIDEPQDNLPWLQELINNTACDCNASIIQYCYNGEVYFDSTPVNPGYCSDYASFIYDFDGNVVCQNGGITGGDCHEILYDFYNTAENIGLVWSCDDQTAGCETLQFTSLNSGCDCCNDIILFEITGGDGNYEVTTLDGQAITNGMGTGIFSIGANELIVTDGQGCSSTGIFQNFPICCEAPPVCEGLQISYNCTSGLQLSGYGDCNSITLNDADGNIYNEGAILADGNYTFIEAYAGQVTPACVSSTLNVNCNDDSTCNLPPDSGPCEAYIPRYYYDNDAKECLQFIYGGCEGNDNNYETYESCTDACGYNYSCPSIEDPLETLAWLQKIAENANGCSVNEITQFTYNSNIYFKTIPGYSGYFCPTDLPINYYNCDGLRICSQGFSPFPTCNQAMVNAANATGSVIWTYSENDCNNLQFDVVTNDCDNCCDETLRFAVSGGDGNYEVTTSDGVAVYDGMPLNAYVGIGTTLIVTDGQGCTAEGVFNLSSLCCEVPPACGVYQLAYDCNEGLQISSGYGNCLPSTAFIDDAGNSYKVGDMMADGNYTLTNTGHPVTPACATYEFTVSCENNVEYCDFDDVAITSNPNLCGFGLVTLTTNDVFGNTGPDDYEIRFVKVRDNNTFVVLEDLSVSELDVCYFAVAYRLSCGAPDFYTNNFNDIIDNAGNYKVSQCFTINSNQALEYSLTTEPFCDGNGLFTVGVTISGGSGSYNLGEDYTGNIVYGGPGENFITFDTTPGSYDIFPIDAVTSCTNESDLVILIDDPGCGTLNVCELPMVIGPCEALIPRYYYDAEQGDCIEFNYGGCNGNANNFETYTACLQACGDGGGCENPFSLEVVQNVINNSNCTEAIYAFVYQDNNYIFFKSSCQANDITSGFYNCSSGVSCSVGGLTNPADNCDEIFYQISNLIIDENIIWQPNDGCSCDTDYTPVCGVDGNTYSNACIAECEGVEVAYDGECEEPCICPAVYEPVCGIDGVTYGNACEAACEGIDIYSEGECGRVELNCALGEPLEWQWMQNLIIEYGGCLVSEIRAFTYQGTQHFVTNPGYPGNLSCATDAPSSYYNCEGDLVCQVGFFSPDDPGFCNENIIYAAGNARVIWTYNETNCADPFELELVENAIEDETCTGGIYAFDFEGESFIYIKTLCEFIDAPNILYNCNTGLNCLIGGETIYVEACYKRFDQVSDLINDANLIWTKPCEYETKATVKSYDCGLVLEASDDLIVEPEIIPDGFNLREGQKVEFSYRRIPIGSTCTFAEKAEIICIREVDEGCACDDVYDPVCGEDGVTYDNSCFAECEGVAIAYEGMCNSNPAIFDKFSWLNELVYFYGACENEMIITEYVWSNVFSFIYILLPDGTGELYYQDGTYYCTDRAGYSCLDIYGITEVADTWTCIQPAGPNDAIELNYGELSCNDDGTFTIELSATGALSKNYGIYHSYGNGQPNFIFFKEEETISFVGNTADAEDGQFTAYIYDQYLADVAAKTIIIDVSACLTNPTNTDKAIFNQYNWLSTIIDPDDCTPGYEINEYDFGSYSFIHIQANNEGNLYLGDGTYYCSDASGFSCIAAYGLTNVTASSSCSNVIDCPDVLEPVCGVDGNTYDNACYAELAGVGIANEGACTTAQLFSQYPWLNEIISESGCDSGNTISEYDLGAYSFIFVESGGFGSLYYQDGTYYCMDASNYSCVELYGFPQASRVWSCDGNLTQKEQNSITNYLKFDKAFKLYPNPSKGKFMIALTEPAQSLKIMSIDGQLVRRVPVENHQSLIIEVDVTGIAKGIYIAQLQTGDVIKTQKVIIH